MRLLYLAQRVPYPPDRGDKIATYHHIRHLAHNHDVSVACVADGEEDLANVEPLSAFVDSVDAVPLSRRRARFRTLAALVAGRPLTPAYFNEPELHQRIADRVRCQPFDAIVVYSSGMAPFVENYASVPRVMAFSDLDSLKWAQYASSARMPLRWVYGVEAHRLLAYERHVATSFDHSLVCSERELKECRRLMPGATISCVSNGVDLDYFRPTSEPKERNNVLFTGIMDYFPNVDGVLWFCREILPQIRKEMPDVTFTICGASPAREIRQLAGAPGVRVTGRVPDVRSYLARALVAVIPLRIARGIQNKLLEAMAMGVPTVASTAAFDGVEATRGVDLLVADDPTEFAGQVVRLLKDSGLRERLGASARTAMAARYAWDVRLLGLDKVLEQVTSRPCASAPCAN